MILRWQIERGVVAIPKSVNTSRIAANLEIFDFNLNEDEMKIIKSFDKGRFGRLFAVKKDGGLFWDKAHPHFPFNIAF